MKTLLIYCVFVFYVSISFSQQSADRVITEDLKAKVKLSSRTLELYTLDSLVLSTRYGFGYKELAKETIDLAAELGFSNIAAKHTVDLINFHTNISEHSEKGLELFIEFLNSDIKVTDTLLMSDLYLKGGNSFFGSGQMKEAENNYTQSMKMALMANDSSRFAVANNYKAFTLLEMGFFTEASQGYQESLSFFEKHNDTINALNTRIGLSVVYGKNEFYKESFEELFKVRDMALALKNSPLFSIAMSNIAVNYYNSEQYDQSIKVLKKNIKLSEKLPFFSYNSSHDYTFLVKSYSKLDSLKAASLVVKKMEKKLINNPDKQLESYFLEAKSHLLFAKKDYVQAIVNGEKLLKMQRKALNYENILSTLNILYQANAILGNDSIAFSYFKEHTRINDSINSVLKVNGLSYYQTLYETEKRDAEITSQKSEIELLDEKSKVQYQWILLLALSILIILIALYLVQTKSKQKAEINKNKQTLDQHKIKATKLENHLLNKEIEYKKKDLVNLAIEITQNQEWANVLFQKFKNLAKLQGQERDAELIEFGNEIKSKMLVDVEVSDFHDQVDVLSSSFYNKLNEQISNLSKTDLRMCSLIRMKLETKQIAILQNISPASVRTSRYRLRKKLNLTQEQDLDNFILNF